MDCCIACLSAVDSWRRGRLTTGSSSNDNRTRFVGLECQNDRDWSRLFLSYQSPQDVVKQNFSAQEKSRVPSYHKQFQATLLETALIYDDRRDRGMGSGKCFTQSIFSSSEVNVCSNNSHKIKELLEMTDKILSIN